MVGVLTLLQEVGRGRPPFDRVDPSRQAAARQAVEKGIACVLRCQVVVNGRKTAWCAQHDETTFAPAAARKYEHISLSGQESVGIVRFLMSIEPPTPEIRDAVESAVAWLMSATLSGIREEMVPQQDLPHGQDVRVVADPKAPPLWARFYEIGTNRPIFSGRDSVIRYQLSEIEAERRAGYHWYTSAPRELIDRDYPSWKKKWRSARP
jgi:PelA/Pel-15E family pectate lyase